MPVRPVPPEPEDAGGGAAVRALQDRLHRTEQDLKRAEDPTAGMFGLLSDLVGWISAQRQAVERLVERLDNQQPKQPAETLTRDQVNVLGIHLVSSWGTWASRFQRSMDLRTGAILAAAGVALILATLSLDRWVLAHPDYSGMRCDYRDDHSRVCWFEVAPAPPLTTPGRH
jgi:hypothetical protein